MINKRVKISNVINNQIPSFVKDNYPLASEFLTSYYKSQDSQSLPSDIINNIDQYVKVDNLTNLILDTSLTSDVGFLDETINVSSTEGFPDQYGIIQIDNEIITYKSKTSVSFTECVRGFSGITSYHAQNRPDSLVFSESEISDHTSGTTVKNLSILLFKEFLRKTKKQIAPGFENRPLYHGVNESLFLKQVKDFYISKGTDQSFEILFRALYGEDVEVNRPSDYLFIPSDAGYRVTNDLVVEAINGDPESLLHKTLYQDDNQYHAFASGTITNVEPIIRGDKTYYVISLDNDYARDIDVSSGTITGKFAITPQTTLTNNVAIGASVIDVDSTVGFAATGQFIADLANGTSVTITYLSKSSNQFFDVSGVTQSLGETQNIRQNTVAYGYTSTDLTDPVEVKVTGVLSDINLPEKNYLFKKGDEFEIQSLGKIINNTKTNNWFYNIKTSFSVKKITEISPSSQIYNIETYETSGILRGDTIVITDNTGSSKTFVVEDIVNEKTFRISGQFLSLNLTYYFQRQIQKAQSTKYPYLNNYISNVQNVYVENDSDIVIASNSLPSYPSSTLETLFPSISFSGSFSGTDLSIPNHPFFTGDAVHYVGTGLNLAESTYFVKVVDNNTIRLSSSKPNISNSIFLTISGSTSNSRLIKFGYKGKDVQPQKLLRKISDPITLKNKEVANPGPIAILRNGVEAVSYKSEDVIYYGPINKVEVTAEGEGYDIITPPIFSITDSQGIDAKGNVSVNGGLERIDIIDPGVDYLDVPSITISGGNGNGAIAEASLINFIYSVSFNSIPLANQVNTSQNTIAFNEKHRIRDAELVFYETDGGDPVGGLVNRSEYYVGVVDAFRLKFYKTKNNAVEGKNAINLTSFGSGTHKISTVNYRKKVASIRVIDSGRGYENKYRETTTAGINTASNVIKIDDHGYKSGDIIRYGTTGNEIVGLSTALSYYVTKVDDNQFHLSKVGIGTTTKDLFFKEKEFIDFKTKGSGIHSFNYEPISVKIEGKVGLNTVTTTNSIIINTSQIRTGITTIVSGVGQTSFAFNYISRPNNPGLLDVFMNGIRLNGDDYDSSSGTEIILNSPATGDEVIEMVSYGSTVRTGFTTVTAGAGQTNFPFNYFPGFLDVYYNGLKLPQRDYESFTGTNVSLNEPAIENDVVELVSYSKIDRREKTFTAQEGQTDFTFVHQIKYGLLDVYVNGVKLNKTDYTEKDPSKITLKDPTSFGDVVYISQIFMSELIGLGDDFNAKIQPIFRGNIETVFLSKNGQNYGSNEILNYNRQPLFTLNSGANAELIPVVNRTTGGIQDVIVKNSGSGYNSPPNLIIQGSGKGAIITPIVRNGIITEVIIINSGSGYDSEKTSVIVEAAGIGAKFNAEINFWNINEVERVFQKNRITGDDGYLLNNNDSIQYTHQYCPRELREQVYGRKIIRGVEVYQRDLIKNSRNDEVESTYHSPIIGWAYDGNPIYGPYGYDTPSGGSIRKMKSSYSTIIKSGRPSINKFPLGFFTNDWIYDGSGDLDEHNGRFCVTPEYPNGVYAYFSTISDVTESDGIFKGYKKPVFPYLIGPYFYSDPIDFNYNNYSNQDSININETGWLRNTDPYKLNSQYASYNYIFNPNKVKKQTSIVKYAEPGGVNDVDVFNQGQNYKIDDKLVFSGGGNGAYANVHRISGKEVSAINVTTTYVEDIEFLSLNQRNRIIGISQSPHNLSNLDIVSISGLSTYRTDLKNDFQIIVSDKKISLSSSIENISKTGIVTTINLNSVPEYPFILENDTLKVNGEDLKVLNVDHDRSRIRVLRAQNSTVGAYHTIGSIISQNSRRIQITTNYENSDSSRINREFYLNPLETVAIGATFGVGITSTLFLGEIEHKSPVSIGTGSSTTVFFQNSGAINNFLGGGYVSIVNPNNVSFAIKNAKVLSVGTTSISIEYDTTGLVGSGVTGYLNKVITEEIPTRSILIRNHELKTGEKVVYNSNGGTPLTVNRLGTISQLTQNQELFVKKVSRDLISLVSNKNDLLIDRNILQFVGLGTGLYHSFKTNFDDVIKGQVEKNSVTVSTSSTHGLSLNDDVFVDVNVAISTNVKVVYNNSNRRLVINPKNFNSSDVDTVKDTIRINNHGFYTGQKVIFTSSSPNSLISDEIYYVVVFDSNKIRLSKTYYESKKQIPIFINFASTFSGTISPINPQIKAYKNQKIVFDLSDSSLSYDNLGTVEPAFDFEIYTDENFENEFISSGDLTNFNVTKEGLIGVDSNANLTLQISNLSPETLYYALKPKFGVIDIKASIYNDKEKIKGSSSIIKVDSFYSGKHRVASIASTSFTYNIKNQPESESYSLSNNSVVYETSSKSAVGPISSIRVSSDGFGYFATPDVANIVSAAGTEAILSPLSKTIGKIKTIKIEDIGFEYSSDLSLTPSVKLLNLLKVERYSSLERVGITSFGRGYTSPPDLLVFDSVTDRELDVVLNVRQNIGKVDILKNTNKIYDAIPRIVPINNSNGIGINTISFEESTGNVTVTLNATFTVDSGFPFVVGDKVFIENVGITTSGRGYNSKNYGYQFFTLESISPQFGGVNPSVTYNIGSLLENGEKPGQFDSLNSSGRIINSGDLPIFEASLSKNSYLVGEKILASDGTIGFVDTWDEKSNLLKVLSPFGRFPVNVEILGQTSNTNSVVVKEEIVETTYKVDSSSKVEKGWKRRTGFLNDNLQRIHDSDYYQYFSYEIKSKVDLNKWDEPVHSLNHTAGYKKFSNLLINSSSSIGVSTAQNEGDFTAVTDIISLADINCYQDWDLVTENYKYINGTLVSDELVFNSKIIQNYFESVTNKVVPFDDISDQFNDQERRGPFSVVDVYLIAERVKKYITYVKDKRFTNERQLMLVSVLHNGIDGFLNQYARIETASDLGSFDFRVDNLQGNLLFYPVKTKVNNYDVSLASYNLIDAVGVGTTNVGSISKIYSQKTTVSSGTTSYPIVSFAATHRAAKVLVSVSATNNYHQFDEISLLRHDNRNVQILEYGQLTDLTLSSPSTSGFGTYDASVPQKTLPTTSISDYFSSAGVTTSPGGSGIGPFGGFAIGPHTRFTGFGNRQLTLQAIDSRRYDSVIIRAVVGSDTNGGEQPESNEPLNLYYSLDGGSSFTNIGLAVPANGSPSLSNYRVILPKEAKNESTIFRLRQQANSGNDFDNYGVTEIVFDTELMYLDFYPNAGFAGTTDALTVGFGVTVGTGIGSMTFNTNTVETVYTGIGSTSTPIANRISGWSTSVYDGAYLMVSVNDSTNNHHEFFEVVAINDADEIMTSEFGNLFTNVGLGTIGAAFSGANVDILYTPNPDIDVDVKVFQHGLRIIDDFNPDTGISFNNASINSGFGDYLGTELDIAKAFNLTYKQKDVFQKYFDPTTDPRIGTPIDNLVVNLNSDVITLDQHFFVTGEEVSYTYPKFGGYEPIGIATTSIPGVGSTDILPPNVHIIKIDDFGVKVAASASDALSVPPKPLNLTTTGIGISHRFISKKQNQRVIIEIDDIIQSPIVATSSTTHITNTVTLFDDFVSLNSISDYKVRDLLQIDSEIFIVDSINEVTKQVGVRRRWMGTRLGIHTSGSVVTKIIGNYNITANTLNFADAPYGPSPIGTITNPPDERDYIGITTRSSFSGRSFMKTSPKNSSIEPYSDNYIFDDISDSFNGIGTEFTLRSNNQNIGGISTDNAIILLDGIFQSPSKFGTQSIQNNQYLQETVGITSIFFNSAPVGGKIVSIASTKGFGYQPLVSAGGTAIVSSSGTISAISIGNSGSGYRSGIQTNINVSVATSNLSGSDHVIVGFATVLDGKVVDVIITNPGTGYTSSNPPKVIFDSPFSYENLELQYASGSSGFGTGAKANVVVGQGSSVIDFELISFGSSYEIGDVLTFAIGGNSGIPTDTSKQFKEFRLTVTDQYQKQFSGWNFGNLTVFDNISNYIDGFATIFPLSIDGERQSVVAREGSGIEVDQLLLVFVNGIIQKPKISYIFDGGSTIEFTEPPKVGDDIVILFYKGNEDIDVIFNDILETVKVGDTLQIYSDIETNRQNARTVFSIDAVDTTKTNTYAGVGILTTGNLRSVVWCKQMVDKLVDGSYVAKDREEYESLVYPTTNIIKPVNLGDREIFVEGAKTFFDSINENPFPTNTQTTIQIIDQTQKVGATAVAKISGIGTVSSIEIINPGYGYTGSPVVTFENPIGLGTTSRATATASISVGGTVTAISINSGGVGYTTDPIILIEPPDNIVETITDVSYSGDFGIISGINTTTIGIASTAIVFDLYIPESSYLRSTDIVGTAVTLSGIQSNYYFVVSNTFVGNGIVSLNSDGDLISNGESFINNVYEAISVSIAQSGVPGVGITDVVKVTVSVADYNGLSGIGHNLFYGNYSWARIEATTRSETRSFSIYNNGLTGISTSPIVRRVNPLEYQNYIR